MSYTDVLLIGYEEQENLGLRSIMSYLISRNCNVLLIPYSDEGWEEIRDAALSYKPRLIGFSIIFQFTVIKFAELVSWLRAEGINCHFTAGGHFPSMEPEETLRLIPGLNSVVRFEGEHTIAELLEHLKTKRRIKDIKGLAYRDNGWIKVNSVRPLITDLDSLPLIYRDEVEDNNEWHAASLLASRGCYYSCSFCSIREFYGSAGGPLRRTRSPYSVADEIEYLHKEKNVIYFVFQDDDFANRNRVQKEWLDEFLKELISRNLDKIVKWKISCRVDDVDEEMFDKMVSCGLTAVYLGVESGNTAGLKTMNKKVTVEQNLKAVRMIKDLGTALAIGFMLFDPSSTFETVSENIGFLKETGSDGYFPINFCKMLPYAGTPIQKELAAKKRLKGSIIDPDYELEDDRLEWYSFVVNRIFKKRNFTRGGLVQRLQQEDLAARLPDVKGAVPCINKVNLIRQITKETNLLALDTLSVMLDLFQGKDAAELFEEENELLMIAEKEWRGEAELINRLEVLLKSDGISG